VTNQNVAVVVAVHRVAWAITSDRKLFWMACNEFFHKIFSRGLRSSLR